jgi:hypothetical protein
MHVPISMFSVAAASAPRLGIVPDRYPSSMK